MFGSRCWQAADTSVSRSGVRLNAFAKTENTMSDSTRVWERLYLGSLVDAEKVASSNPFEITTVVSLCSQQVYTKGAGIHYIKIPVTDGCSIDASKFDLIMACVDEGIRKGRVLLHCVSGVSRSPILAAAWMHRYGYLNFDLALREIAELRPVIDPCAELCASVKEHLQ
jgi:predicted protein tyrosine phosphatase